MAGEPNPDVTMEAVVLRDRLADGSLTAAKMADACLARIEKVEPDIRAFEHIDPDYVRKEAARHDALRRSGRPIGPLHGLPIAIKDIIDVAGMPTGNGSPLCAGQTASRDATLVASLKRAGALVLGKAVTTEFATYFPGKTRNPHNLEHTPGGSSSGSAAAVAAGEVPVAVGTQTNGSVIRPAAFCGVVGYKPSYGAIPRNGVLSQSPFLDQIGVFGRSVADVALIADVLFGFDPDDSATTLQPAPRLLDIAAETPPLEPLLAFAPTAKWDETSDATKAGFGELTQDLKISAEGIVLPDIFAEIWSFQNWIMVADIARNLGPYEMRGAELISAKLRAQMAQGREVRAVDYATAMAHRSILNHLLDEVFDAVDALITPSAPGSAPLSLEATGDPTFCTTWTYLGLPAVTLPLLQDEAGLPIGVQVVGRYGDDARLLRTARWLMKRFGPEAVPLVAGDAA